MEDKFSDVEIIRRHQQLSNEYFPDDIMNEEEANKYNWRDEKIHAVSRYQHADGSSIYWSTNWNAAPILEKDDTPDTICVKCGDNFNKFSGDVDKRICTTCVLKKEDPDTIKLCLSQ